ncbi:MAG TPA: hypothetical protein VFR94_10980 [Nitrososphaeraceae archaeon]|nr:hypothetical protein [Nitrososphaeraceae archaeon]
MSDKQIESKELEWYLRDHFFRQSNKGVTQFERKSLTQDMITLYLRYRNYSRQRIEEMINPVLENLISRRVITGKDNNNKKNNSDSNFDLNSFELTSPLSRLQCPACFYISYLSTAEPRSCLRCSSINLHDFPPAKQKRTHRE